LQISKESQIRAIFEEESYHRRLVSYSKSVLEETRQEFGRDRLGLKKEDVQPRISAVTIMRFLDSVFALGSLCASMSSISLQGLPFVPHANIDNRVSYDTSQTFVSFSPSGPTSHMMNRAFSTPIHLINDTYSKESLIVDTSHMNLKAFGYISPAPKWSTVLHTERHGALYFTPVPKFTISYPTGLRDPVIMSVTSDYMVCAEYLDVNLHVILHCRTSDTLTVSSFFEVVI
jgi:hypothetical protein